MRFITLVMLVIIVTFTNIKADSKEYIKKKNNYHSLGIGIGYASISTDAGADYNPGKTISGGYTYNKKALMWSVNLYYTTFAEYE